MSPEQRYQPELIEEAENLLGTPFFTNEKEYDNVDFFDEDSIGLKRFIYRSVCRVLATARHDARELAPAIEDARAWNDDDWRMTTRKMAEIAFKYQGDVMPLARHLALINGATDFAADNWDDLCIRLHEDQQLYMLDILDALQKPPREVTYVNELGDSFQYMVHGTTVVAPTGFGKSRLIEACAKIFEPGKVPENSKRITDSTRILVVSPAVHLVTRLAKDLAEQLPDVRVGVMHRELKQPDADLVVSTIEMFTAEFEDNRISGHPVSLLAIDEGHHLVEPQFRKTFVTQWRGPTLVFTATPAYDLQNDVRAILPHTVEKTNILQSIDKGTLNDGQIFTFFIDSIVYGRLLERYGVDPTDAQSHAIVREVIDTLTLEFVTPLLAEGRRGIIFCEQGDEAYWADHLAQRLQKIKMPDGRFVRAESMNSYEDNQHEVIERFHGGKLDVITTVDTGREGLDANFDFVIVNCNIVSRLRGNQIVGRGTRRSKRFPITVYGQFSYHFEGTQFERLYSVEEAFGGSVIDSGHTLRHRYKGPDSRIQRPAEPIDISAFSDIIREILERIDRKPIGEVFVGVNRGDHTVVDGLIPLLEIIKGYQVTEARAKKLLRREGYRWYGRIEDEDGIGRRLMHYYTAEARDFLHQVLPKDKNLTPDEIARTHNLLRIAVKNAIDSLGLSGRHVSRGVPGKPPITFNEQEQSDIVALAKSIPGTGKGDRPLQEVAREIGADVATVWKWSGASDEGRIDLGGVRYLTALEIATAQAEFTRIPLAEPDDKTLSSIAEMVGIDYQVVDRNMTTTDWSAARVRRYRDKRDFLRTAQVWSAAAATDIARRMERFKARPLEAHHMPSSPLRHIVRNYSVTSPDVIAKHLAEGCFEYEEFIIAGTRSMSRCLSWPAIAYLVEKMGTKKGDSAIKLDFERLPSGPDDLDPDKIAYAQSIQAQLLTSAKRKDYGVVG